MNKQQYWKAHVAKNPSFSSEDKTIQIKVGMLKKLLEEAFDKGIEHGKASLDFNKTLTDLLKKQRY